MKLQTLALRSFLFLLALATAFGQLNRGFISGTLEDSSGAVLVGATVQITNAATNITRDTVTNDAGYYRFVAVEPGTYGVEYGKEGFERKKIAGVIVGPTQEVVINQMLAVSGAAAVVEVQDTPPGVELSKSTATIERTLNQKTISEMPIFASSNQDRDITRLALLAPTVSRAGGSTQISANGQRARNNNFTIDGVDNNDLSVTNTNSRTVPEGVQEFQVQTQAYSAEFGRNSGAQISIITRSGGNAFHGDAYDYYNGNWLQPLSLLNERAGLTRTPRFVQNEPGGDIGGPVIRNRTFFFFLIETNRRREAASATNANSVTIPTPTGYAALSSVPLATGETAEARAAALKAISFFPNIYPQIPRFDNVVNTTVNGVPIEMGTARIPIANPFDFWYYQGRVDHKLTNVDNITYRFQLDKRNQPNLAGLDNNGFGSRFAASQAIFAQNHSLSETRTFGPSIVNEFRFAFVRRNLDFPENDPTTPTTTVGASFTIGGLTTFPQGRIQNTFQYQDIATFTRGRHSVKTGFDVRFNRLFNRADFDSKGTYTFNNFAAFLNSQPQTILQAVNTASADARQTNQYYFVQDDFRATKNLTFNVGVRYEYSDVPFGFFGAANDAVAAVGVPRNVKPDKNNWAPRLGFAYSPTPQSGFLNKLLGDGRTVFRGGYGVAYDVLFYNILTVNASNYPRVIRNQVDLPNGNNLYPATIPRQASVPALNPLAQFVNAPTDMQNPTTHFYSFGIQRQFATNYVLEVAYTGSRAYHGINQSDSNYGILTPEQAATVISTKNAGSIPTLQQRRLNPAWGDRVLIASDGTANYNAGYVRLDKRLSHGIAVGGNYTYSALFSNNDESLGVTGVSNYSPQLAQDYRTFKTEYSRSVFDKPHRAVFYYTWELPWFTGDVLNNGFMRRVFRGWQLNGFTEFQSGTPFTLLTGVDSVGNGGSRSSARPNYNPGGVFLKDPVSGDLRTFTIPLNGTGIVVTPLDANGLPLANSMPFGGNLGKNTFRGPNFQTWNFSLAKNVEITERVRVNLRADWTDIFNHRNFGPPVNNMSAPNFGTNTGDPGTRSAFLGAKVTF